MKLRMTQHDIFEIRQAYESLSRRKDWNPTKKARFIKQALHLPFSVTSVMEVATNQTYVEATEQKQ